MTSVDDVDTIIEEVIAATAQLETDVVEPDFAEGKSPKIALADKGKAPLDEPDTIKGHPAREMFHLICGDIDILVQLREREQVLTWRETDSVQIALQRRLYILAKYSEMLLWKFLESHRANFSFGQPWSAMALQIIDLLSTAHNTAVKELLTQKQAIQLEWTRPCCSTLFEGAFDRGFYIPRNHKTIFSTCWIRNHLKSLVGDGVKRSTLAIIEFATISFNRRYYTFISFFLLEDLKGTQERARKRI
ncbi:hypothetical protein F511_40251 [Dorcoceras hygrometricum]|uniref:Uncharacterized protein n=1 Tax=Dorcoceras hygrometricum TaxID=472368 RepID=A0A2Z6ZZS7_9LAMI|nr:hypothetical protein F511_40251 [Dorcoceras hygrometricum]